jgi:hypothetical protein
MDYVKKKRYNWGDNSKNGKHKLHACNANLQQLIMSFVLID